MATIIITISDEPTATSAVLVTGQFDPPLARDITEPPAEDETPAQSIGIGILRGVKALLEAQTEIAREDAEKRKRAEGV